MKKPLLWNKSEAYFVGWFVCPVCKKEPLHFTKDMHDIPVSNMHRILCDDCRVVQMQFKQTANRIARNAGLIIKPKNVLSVNRKFYPNIFPNETREKYAKKSIN